MAKNLLNKIGKGFAIAGISALSYLPMNSNADIVEFSANAGTMEGEELYSAICELAHEPNSLEEYDSNDKLWSSDPPGSGETLRPFTQVEHDGTLYDAKKNSKPLESTTPYEIFADIQNVPDGETVSSTGNQFVFELIDGPDEQRQVYDWKIDFNYDSENNVGAVFQDGTTTKSGRWDLSELSEGAKLELPKYDIHNVSNGDNYMGGDSYLKGIPEPNTLILLGLGVAAGLPSLGRRNYSRKNRR